ncbi:helicase-associated domain-containing protein [Pengzhenrongella sp.]|uniref:helicase-associated domain-containing protein n=1 Tax=Pengzhenrongella sp. TaxID=2888820 RepID=UPI002F93DDD9
MIGRDELRTWLAGRSPEDLEQTLALRPDVLWGAPVSDLDDLADRLVHTASVATSVADLPVPGRQALEVLMAAGAGASLERATDLLDASASGHDGAEHRARVEVVLRALECVALIWPGADGRLVVNPGLRQVIPAPLGLGPPAEILLENVSIVGLKKIVKRRKLPVRQVKAGLVEEIRTFLADPARIRKVLSEAPEPVIRALLDDVREAVRRAQSDDEVDDVDVDPLRWRNPKEYAILLDAAAWASENGLGFTTYSATVALCSEVGLALLDADFKAPFAPVPPTIAIAAVTEQQARATASGAITEFLSTAMATLETAARAPLVQLVSGGIGARELTRVAKALGTSSGAVRMALELGIALELLEVGDNRTLTTTSDFGEWRRLDPARRAADLIATWFASDFVPTIERDLQGRTLPALIDSGEQENIPELRVLTFAYANELEDGRGVTSLDSLVAHVAWRVPQAMAGGAEHYFRANWDESERLGVLAHGRLTDLGNALLDANDDGLAEALTAMLPGVQTKAMFGSDLTVVVAGSPAPAIVDLLDAVAAREGRGVASTWRITPESVRTALDDGYALDELSDRLRGLADGDLPQALEYLLRDVGRRYGHLQVRPAHCLVLSDDEALLAEVEVNRALRKFGLRRVAPTVLIADAAPQEVAAGLRAAGYLPLEESASGDPVVQLRPASGGAGAGESSGGPNDVGDALPAGSVVESAPWYDDDDECACGHDHGHGAEISGEPALMLAWLTGQLDGGGTPGAFGEPQESSVEAAARLTAGG